jgi:alpha-tubulin suppressor-like RCC1 family protein
VNNVLFNKLKDHFREDNIEFSLKTSNRVFIVTKRDLFYEIDIYDDRIPSFVLNNDNSIIDSMLVNELCDKRFIEIIYGFQHYIAKSIDNKIYFMSYNNSEVNKVLCNLNINVIKCGFSHTVVLTSEGEVYVWGHNSVGQLGLGCYERQSKPIKLTGFDSEKIIMISCGSRHTLALAESGRVFDWGINVSSANTTQTPDNHYYGSQPRTIAADIKPSFHWYPEEAIDTHGRLRRTVNTHSHIDGLNSLPIRVFLVHPLQ